MTTGKTRDGIKLNDILRVLSEMPEVSIRDGTNHNSIALIEGRIPCPGATSSDARRMIAPWVARATGYKARKLYDAFKAGTLYA